MGPPLPRMRRGPRQGHTLAMAGLWFLPERKQVKMAQWLPRSRQRLHHLRAPLTARLAAHIPPACRHLKGRGGVKGAIRTLMSKLPESRYVARFDIKSYYTSIVHAVLLGQLRGTGASAYELTLIDDFLRLPDIHCTGRGLVATGGLAPLLGGLYLAPLDRAMVRRQRAGKLVCYVRYMDDIILLAKSRWQLRRAIAELHACLRPLHLRLHPEKRFIGKLSRGFDFLGYQLHPGRKLRPSPESFRRLRERARRLYEREADVNRLRQYVTRWWCWLGGGLDGLVSRQGGPERTMRHILSTLHIVRQAREPPSRVRDG